MPTKKALKGTIPVNDVQLYFESIGQGAQNLLWDHGLPLNSKSWTPQLQHFNPLCRNTLFDLRGYGKSSKLPKDYANLTDLYLSDILSVMDHCQLKKTVLIGFASAWHAALRFAALYPERLSKLIVINGSPCLPVKIIGKEVLLKKVSMKWFP
jgi:non-heme chloroperoxidase